MSNMRKFSGNDRIQGNFRLQVRFDCTHTLDILNGTLHTASYLRSTGNRHLSVLSVHFWCHLRSHHQPKNGDSCLNRQSRPCVDETSKVGVKCIASSVCCTACLRNLHIFRGILHCFESRLGYLLYFSESQSRAEPARSTVLASVR